VWVVGAAASSLEAVSAVSAVLAAGVAAVAPDRAGSGHRLWVGSIAAGAALRPRQGPLLSRPSKSRRQPVLREDLTKSEPRKVRHDPRRLFEGSKK
jgi:hypothetical protein